MEASLIPVSDPDAELPPAPPPGEPASVGLQIISLLAILIPLVGVAIIPFFVWEWGFRWVDLWLLLAMYVLTTLGVTVGFHRHFVHRSFETYPWIRFLMVVWGSMAVQGSLFQWVGLHRLHHHFSDTMRDPHTPHHRGGGIGGVLRGFWHAHIGWFFERTPDLGACLKDLTASRMLRVADALFPLWVILGLLLPALAGLLIIGDASGFWTGLIWGGLVRIFIVHHLTWSINSACHLWGRRPYQSRDMSRNNAIFGVLGMGEGWHNAHHAFPSSARHGLRWWEFDVSYGLIDLLARLRLAWNIKVPSEAARRLKLR